MWSVNMKLTSAAVVLALLASLLHPAWAAGAVKGSTLHFSAALNSLLVRISDYWDFRSGLVWRIGSTLPSGTLLSTPGWLAAHCHNATCSARCRHQANRRTCVSVADPAAAACADQEPHWTDHQGAAGADDAGAACHQGRQGASSAPAAHVRAARHGVRGRQPGVQSRQYEQPCGHAPWQ